MANTNNLIYCTPTEEETEAKIEKSGSKQKSRSDARPHPYGRPPTGTNSETDLHSLLNCDLTPDQKEVFERCLEAAVQDPAPHHLAAASFRQPVHVKPHLPSLMDLPLNIPTQVKNPTSIIWEQQQQQPRQFSDAVQAPRNQLPKREIVLDGLNIGKVYGRSKFSALGVEKTLAWFTSRGFKVKPITDMMFL